MSDGLTKKTIAHALFTYTNEAGGESVAFRGQTVELRAADVKRGEQHDAFTEAVGERPEPQGSVLPPFPREGESYESEQDAWVKAATVNEILDAVNADPSIADDVIAAETRRKDSARSTLLKALADISNPA